MLSAGTLLLCFMGAQGTLVVANMQDGTASVIDVDSGHTRATLPTGRWPHEVTVSHNGRFAVVTNYGVREAPGNTLTVIDLDNLTGTRTIDLGDYQRPHGATFLRGDALLAVTSEASQRVLLVDVAAGTVVGTMPTGQSGSHMLAATADGKRVYTTNGAPGTITELSVTTRSALRTLRVAPKVEAIGVAPDGKQVWVGSSERGIVSIVDVSHGRVVHTLTDFGYPYRIAFTPDASLVLISDPMKSELRFVKTSELSQRTLKIPADGVLPSSEFEGSASPEGISITPDGKTAFVTLQGRNKVVAIDLPSQTITRYFDTGAWPDGIGYSRRVVER